MWLEWPSLELSHCIPGISSTRQVLKACVILVRRVTSRGQIPTHGSRSPLFVDGGFQGGDIGQVPIPLCIVDPITSQKMPSYGMLGHTLNPNLGTLPLFLKDLFPYITHACYNRCTTPRSHCIQAADDKLLSSLARLRLGFQILFQTETE